MEALHKMSKKINQIIQRILGKQEMGEMTPKGQKASYILKIANGKTALNPRQYVGEINSAIYKVGGMELPVGSFSMEGNTITVEEPVQITSEGEMFISGKPMTISKDLQEEIAFQIQKNGKLGKIEMDQHGRVQKNRAQEYRDAIYDPESRERTEAVSEEYRRQPVRTRDKQRKGEVAGLEI